MGIKSVTEILNIINKPALVYWANKIGLQGIKLSEYKKDGTSIGTLAHAIIENWIKKCKTNFNSYTKKQIKQACQCSKMFFDWVKKQKEFIPIASELQLISQKYDYTGIIDLIAIINGKLALIDFKTCNIYDEAKYQVAAYFNLINEYQNFKELKLPRDFFEVEKAVIIKISKNNDFEIIEVKNLNKYFNVFKSALELTKSIENID